MKLHCYIPPSHSSLVGKDISWAPMQNGSFGVAQLVACGSKGGRQPQKPGPPCGSTYTPCRWGFFTATMVQLSNRSNNICTSRSDNTPLQRTWTPRNSSNFDDLDLDFHLFQQLTGWLMFVFFCISWLRRCQRCRRLCHRGVKRVFEVSSLCGPKHECYMLQQQWWTLAVGRRKEKDAELQFPVLVGNSVGLYWKDRWDWTCRDMPNSRILNKTKKVDRHRLSKSL